ncbi:hypothetical protein FTW19_12575 [Terriglobus albidus]|uniref:Uncharacterized protein n=1 Tax=Terriglobus albidus TaxID=1592106 RepID=A0A5B9EEC4_9BACT|nr:hypothetical protein [Terriglobus albidus]QEE28761.1 hypothetical protein FTW19_12575 [Terriglobus albidus]
MKLTSHAMKHAAVTLCVGGVLVLVATFFEALLPFAKKAAWIILGLAMLVSITEGFPPRKSFWSRYPLWVPYWLKMTDAIMGLLAVAFVVALESHEPSQNQKNDFAPRVLAFFAINASIRSAAYWHSKGSCDIPLDPWDHSSSPETLDERLDAIRDEHLPSLSQKGK